MEREVFQYGGTLDKYLGDGLMATFGTPFAGDSDALNALRCARGMIASIAELNRERRDRNEPPIQVSVGLHYGQVVLWDIGLNRLEFAVIGTTVNAASRLEALTANSDAPSLSATRWCSRRGRNRAIRVPTSYCLSSNRRRSFVVSSNRLASGHAPTLRPDALKRAMDAWALIAPHGFFSCYESRPSTETATHSLHGQIHPLLCLPETAARRITAGRASASPAVSGTRWLKRTRRRDLHAGIDPLQTQGPDVQGWNR